MRPKRKTMAGIGKGVDALFANSNNSTKESDDKEISNSNDIQLKRQIGRKEASKASSKQKDKDVSSYNDIQIHQEESELERVTFYIRPEENMKIEELRMKLRKQKVKTNKSELVREAINLLLEQDVQTIAKKIQESSK